MVFSCVTPAAGSERNLTLCETFAVQSLTSFELGQILQNIFVLCALKFCSYIHRLYRVSLGKIRRKI